MSQEAERIKKIVAFKQKLEKRVEELKSELTDLQATLDTVNAILLEKGFKRAEVPTIPTVSEALSSREEQTVATTPSQPSTEHENVVPLTAVTGELLAILHISEDTVQVLPAEDKDFDSNTPPFASFLIERVLTRMQEKDNELARAGTIPPDKVFSYNISKEGHIIRQITIKHVDQDRLRELKSSIRWTLEKMYEKMKSQA